MKKIITATILGLSALTLAACAQKTTEKININGKSIR